MRNILKNVEPQKKFRVVGKLALAFHRFRMSLNPVVDFSENSDEGSHKATARWVRQDSLGSDMTSNQKREGRPDLTATTSFKNHGHKARYISAKLPKMEKVGSRNARE